MSELAEKYRLAVELARKYRMTPKAVTMVKGSRKRAHEAILVSKQEVTQLAEALASSRYSNYCHLIEIQNLLGYMEQLATGEDDAVECESCHRAFREGWLGGKCPYCEASDSASDYVRKMTKEVVL